MLNIENYEKFCFNITNQLDMQQNAKNTQQEKNEYISSILEKAYKLYGRK